MRTRSATSSRNEMAVLDGRGTPGTCPRACGPGVTADGNPSAKAAISGGQGEAAGDGVGDQGGVVVIEALLPAHREHDGVDPGERVRGQ